MTIQDLDKLVRGISDMKIKEKELVRLKGQIDKLVDSCDHFWPDKSSAVENRICKICKRVSL